MVSRYVSNYAALGLSPANPNGHPPPPHHVQQMQLNVSMAAAAAAAQAQQQQQQQQLQQQQQQQPSQQQQPMKGPPNQPEYHVQQCLVQGHPAQQQQQQPQQPQQHQTHPHYRLLHASKCTSLCLEQKKKYLKDDDYHYSISSRV